MRKTFMCVALAFMGALHTLAKDVVDYVNPLVGTMSKFELSTGNNYPALGHELLDAANRTHGRRMGIRLLARQDTWL